MEEGRRNLLLLNADSAEQKSRLVRLSARNATDPKYRIPNLAKPVIILAVVITVSLLANMSYT